jgi:hypothetical protein
MNDAVIIDVHIAVRCLLDVNGDGDFNRLRHIHLRESGVKDGVFSGKLSKGESPKRCERCLR